MDNSESIAVVHNGIIENYLPLKAKLESKGYHFVSDTDTEVVAHLIDYYYKGNPLEAILKVMHRVQGSYALGIMFAEHPDEIFAVRKDSPLIVGQNEEGCFIASDVPAILKYTRKVYFIENQEIVRLRADGMQLYTIDEEEIEKEPLAKIDYVKIVDLSTMQQIDTIEHGILAAMAVYIGKTRLIDNFMIED